MSFSKALGSWQCHTLNALLRMRRSHLESVDDLLHLRSRVSRLDRWRGCSVVNTISFERRMMNGVPVDHLKPRLRPSRGRLLYLHGGAFCFHSPWHYRRLVMDFCRKLDVHGLLPDYRLAPEHPFPAALDDCFSCYRELLNEGVSPEDIVLAGDSAGGQLALGVMLKVREAGLPQPSCAVLISTGGDWTLGGGSFIENAKRDAMFRVENLRFLRSVYLRDVPPDSPLASPLFADLHGLPPLYLVASRHEMMRDVSVAIAAKVNAAGGLAELRLWNHVCHAFPLSNFLPEAASARADIVSFIESQIRRPQEATRHANTAA